MMLTLVIFTMILSRATCEPPIQYNFGTSKGKTTTNRYQNLEKFEKDLQWIYKDRNMDQELKNELIKEVAFAKMQEDADAIVGSVAGRSAIDVLYRNHVKRYLPEKTPGVPYTEKEMKDAYVACLTDPNNALGTELMNGIKSKCPDMKPQELAKKIRDFHGKCSYLAHYLFETLIKFQSLDSVIGMIHFIPPVLTNEEKIIVEEIAHVLLALDKSFTSTASPFEM